MAKNKKTKYETHVEPRLIEVEGMARDGLIDEQIAKNLGIAYSTFKVYKNKHVAFSSALKKGKEVVDREVENALLKKAMGHIQVVKKAFKVKEVLYEGGRRVSEKEKIVTADEEMYIPPDTTAQIFWLKNRKPEEWRDRRDHKFINKIKEMNKEGLSQWDIDKEIKNDGSGLKDTTKYLIYLFKQRIKNGDLEINDIQDFSKVSNILMQLEGIQTVQPDDAEDLFELDGDTKEMAEQLYNKLANNLNDKHDNANNG